MTSNQSSDMSASSALARFTEAAKREHATTRKVLDALPTDKADFKPHEKSKSAKDLAWTFVVEEQLILKALRGQPFGGASGPAPKTPETFDKVLDALEQSNREMLTELEGSTNASLDGTVEFPTGPKQMGDIPLEQFLWFVLHDQIHHRGQLSIYVRMTGGKVPSIYGPSADEPW
jgi:uncharacterized damage-inducible protein DinB